MKKYSSAWFLHHMKNNRASQWLAEHRELYLMAMTRNSCRPCDSALPYRINHWEDFAYFEETESWHDKDRFLQDMERKRLCGDSCATLVLDEQLAFMELFSTSSNCSHFTDVDVRVVYPPFTATAYSAYVHPRYRGKKLFSHGVKFISRHLFENTDTELVVSAVRCENRSAHSGHLASGFHSVARLEKTCHFGNVANSVTDLHPDYRLRAVEHESSCWRLESSR